MILDTKALSAFAVTAHSNLKPFWRPGRSDVNLRVMSDGYHQLLDATIDYLQGLKQQGVRYINLSLTPEKVGRGVPAEPQRPAQRDVSPYQSKAEAMDALRQQALACVKCSHLAAARKNVVFGVGSIDAELMFVGEAPGADEDLRGEPFVGAAGQLLTKIIQAMGLSRQTVYIANILKCRPDTPGQASGNRKPTLEEMQTCVSYLQAQIDLIKPKVMVALGGTATEGLLGLSGIMKLRGNWQTYRGIPVMPTYHPSYLLRNQAPAEKRRVWEDMMQVMEKLGLPISEKQRGYFL
jgi:uracil-DNA glycosylase family 4